MTTALPGMTRHSFAHDGMTFSYLDSEGAGEPVVALHALWMEAGTWASLARALVPGRRVVAPDQRGHGFSAHAADLGWNAYVDDLEFFLQHLRITQPVVLIGNSLGGTVAFMFAARHPERVRAMVLEESPAEERAELDFMRAWAGVFPTRAALLDTVGERLAWSVEPSVRETDTGWTLAFSPDALADSAAVLNGDFRDAWRASRCPALVLRGMQSRAVDGAILEQMATSRQNTEIARFDAGHVIHHEQPEVFERTVRDFLDRHAPATAAGPR